MEKIELDREKYYRLLDVLDWDGNSKVDSNMLYYERVGGIATNLRLDGPFGEGQFVARMDFVLDKNQRWCRLSLRTSLVSRIWEDEGRMEIETMNSRYVLEPIDFQLQEEVPQSPFPQQEFPEDTEHIELFLSCDGNQFVKGFYHDGQNHSYALKCWVHGGRIQDSCLIHLEEGLDAGIVCRYFPQGYGVEFYQDIYSLQSYGVKLRIHNTAKRSLCVRFQFSDKGGLIPPGEYVYAPLICP